VTPSYPDIGMSPDYGRPEERLVPLKDDDDRYEKLYLRSVGEDGVVTYERPVNLCECGRVYYVDEVPEGVHRCVQCFERSLGG